jgi:hypothetical protein
MKRCVRSLFTSLMLAGAIVLPTGIAHADHTPTPFFQPPPGCTDDWNTAQSAAGATAPVHHVNGEPSETPNQLSPGCTKHT